jgi:predicted Zn-dependent protease
MCRQEEESSPTSEEGRRLEAALAALFAREQWAEAEMLLRTARGKHPEDHWLLTQLADTVYEQRRYRTALGLYRKARALAPKCPLVRWGLAGAATARGETLEATRLYQSLARLDPEVVANQGCWEGLRWARGLIADAHFRLGQLAEEAGSRTAARRHYQAYLRALERPARSIESRKEARARLRALDAPA